MSVDMLGSAGLLEGGRRKKTLGTTWGDAALIFNGHLRSWTHPQTPFTLLQRQSYTFVSHKQEDVHLVYLLTEPERTGQTAVIFTRTVQETPHPTHHSLHC
jgi:hypothetical protein